MCLCFVHNNNKRDPPLLFIYFQVNTGVLYFLDYVEDVYIIMVLSVLVSILNLNHTMYLPLLLTVYCIALYTYKLCTTIGASLFSFQSLTQNHTNT